MGESPGNSCGFPQALHVTPGGVGGSLYSEGQRHAPAPRLLDLVPVPHVPTGPSVHRPTNHWPRSQPCFLPQDIYENLDLRQRRASSPGYIDSPTYSRQGMSPTLSRSPHHYYRSGKERGEPGDRTVARCPSCRDSTGLPQDLCHSMALLWRPVGTQMMSWASLKLCRCPWQGHSRGMWC